VSWRDEIKSSWYWAAAASYGLFIVFGGFRVLGVIFYLAAVALMSTSRLAPRLRGKRKTAVRERR
jgi:hypothetical protein